MIQFIEKEGRYDGGLFTGNCFYYPTYMIKDGKEFFMFNRIEPDDKWNLEANEARKKQLIKNNGKFFKFFGFYNNPIEMLKEIVERKHHFTMLDKMYYEELNKNGYLDFCGNREEVSASFNYRIYDGELAHTIIQTVEYINSEKWNEAMQLLK